MYGQFGVLSEEQWDYMTKYSVKAGMGCGIVSYLPTLFFFFIKIDGTSYRLHYDPAIGQGGYFMY